MKSEFREKFKFQKNILIILISVLKVLFTISLLVINSIMLAFLYNKSNYLIEQSNKMQKHHRMRTEVFHELLTSTTIVIEAQS